MISRILIITTILSLMCGCGNSSTKDNLIRTMQPSSKSFNSQGKKIVFSLTTTTKVDSVQLFIDDKHIATIEKGGYSYQTTQNDKIGDHTYKFIAYKKRSSHQKSGKFTITPPSQPKNRAIKSLSQLPHSRNSYTQGLEFHDGKLYESSGEYGKSYLQILEFPSMKVLKRVDLEAQYFAEGITIIDGKLYLLTWKEHRCFVFDAATLEKIGEYSYNTEGWGLTNDGTHLYMSDGTEYIYKIDPNGFKIVDKIKVLTPKGSINYVNELEWIDGKIWANIYGYESIIIVNPESGAVEEILTGEGLLKEGDKDETTDVFNGIAYQRENKKIYVTGKNWPKMFEIER